jgi:hypothetical protein
MSADAWLQALTLAKRWLEAVYTYSASKESWNPVDRHLRQSHPVLTMDQLPHAGVSQVHPHLHMMAGNYFQDKSINTLDKLILFSSGDGHYFGQLRHLASAAAEYSTSFDKSYFDAYVQAHIDLGLAMRAGRNTVIIAPIDAHKVYLYFINATDLRSKSDKLIFAGSRAASFERQL